MESLVLPVPVAIASSMDRRPAPKASFNCFDRALLVIAQRKAKLEWHFLERGSCGILVNLKLPQEFACRR